MSTPSSSFVTVTHNIAGKRIYLFHRKPMAGSKLIVVVDDQLPDFDDEGQTFMEDAIPGTEAAVPLLEVAKTWPETKAIAFITAFPPDKTGKLVDVLEWLTMVIGDFSQDEIYYLLDLYYGTDIGSAQASPMAYNYYHLLVRLLNANHRVRYGMLSRAPQDNEMQGILILPSKKQIQTYFKENKDLPDQVLSFFGKSNLPVTDLPHKWELETWQRVRDAAARLYGEQQNWNTPHHFPHGDMGDPAFNDIAFIKLAKKIKEAANLDEQIVGRFNENGVAQHGLLPDYGWIEPAGNLDSYRKPPIRALAQRSNTGHDLTTNIYLAAYHLRQNSEISNLDFHYFITNNSAPPANNAKLGRVRAFKHDYLWFNAPALLHGLIDVAREFGTIVGEIRTKTHSPHEGAKAALVGAVLEDMTAMKGRLVWHFNEVTEGESKGLQINVLQSVIFWHSFNNNYILASNIPDSTLENLSQLVSQPSLCMRPYPFPLNPEKKLAEALEYVTRSGAQIVGYGDILQIFVKAKPMATGDGTEYWVLDVTG
jgi:hypothetical protein